jgi:8-oxo-dGTP pyrophosphatase MutT (NUDIX family)
MSTAAPGLLARGPWNPDRVKARWSEQAYEPPPGASAAADAAVAALAERGSPSHDGLAARLTGHSVDPTGSLTLELQPARWSLRLVEGDASASVAALCAVRDSEGRWLAGRRAAWLASWPGRWALGAGGAVDVGENPVDTLVRELEEEWSVAPERVRGEALVLLPHALVMFIGQAWLPPGAEVEMDHEHDDHAWWPADVRRWPQEADEPLRRMATLLQQDERP